MEQSTGKLDRLLQSVLIALSIFLLYKIFRGEVFARIDYILLIIDGIAGFILLLKGAERKRNEN